MKKIISSLFIALLVTQQSGQAQIKDAGYMGLWDLSLATGYLASQDYHNYQQQQYENSNSMGAYLLMHIQESALSNYIWAAESDKKIKFGFQETLDVGVSRQSFTTRSSNARDTTRKAYGFLFSYEAAAACVYKINDHMDAGLTYYFFSLTSFNPNSHRYAKFRFRYNHLMAECTAFGRTAFDFKYLFGLDDRTSNTYVGLSYYRYNGKLSTEIVKRQNSFLQLSYGMIF